MDDVKIQPLGNRILIKPEEIQEKTPGGLIVPPSATEERSKSGIIIKLGVGKHEGEVVSFDVKVGDKIAFSGFTSKEVEDGGEKYLIIDANDVLAKI